jgi:hypothetical protein
MEYPKMLFGPAGWANTQDHVIVYSASEENATRARGYADMATVEAKKNPDHKPAHKPARTAK